jgi:hypothetical protein
MCPAANPISVRETCRADLANYVALDRAEHRLRRQIGAALNGRKRFILTDLFILVTGLYHTGPHLRMKF